MHRFRLSDHIKKFRPRTRRALDAKGFIKPEASSSQRLHQARGFIKPEARPSEKEQTDRGCEDQLKAEVHCEPRYRLIGQRTLKRVSRFDSGVTHSIL